MFWIRAIGALVVMALSAPPNEAAGAEITDPTEPGAGRLAVGAGVEGPLPAFDVRAGITPRWSIRLDGVWHTVAPRVGAETRLTVGGRAPILSANLWLDTRWRPLTDGRRLAGMDAALGVGLFGRFGRTSARLDGGIDRAHMVHRVDDPHLSVELDQQGGWYALQRASLSVDLITDLALVVEARIGVPLQWVDVDAVTDELKHEWLTRFGVRLRWRI